MGFAAPCHPSIVSLMGSSNFTGLGKRLLEPSIYPACGVGAKEVSRQFQPHTSETQAASPRALLAPPADEASMIGRPMHAVPLLSTIAAATTPWSGTDSCRLRTVRWRRRTEGLRRRLLR